MFSSYTYMYVVRPAIALLNHAHAEHTPAKSDPLEFMISATMRPAEKKKPNIFESHSAKSQQFLVHSPYRPSTSAKIRMRIYVMHVCQRSTQQTTQPKKARNKKPRAAISCHVTRTHHTHEQPWLLCRTADTSVTDNTNRKTSSETSETN